MHTEVFNYIDTLIDMAGGASKNLDETNAELITIRRTIRNKTNELEDIKSIMSDARYFNASNELVDKNIEISLKNKITRLKRKVRDIETSSDELKASEATLHEEINNLTKKLTKNDKYIGILENKVNTSKVNDYYTSLLQEEKNNNTELKSILETKKEEYNSLLKNLELNNQATTELKEKLANEEERLNDILDNLKNPNTYIDEDLKASDNEKVSKLEKEIEDLEKKELELLTSASVIGAEAKELIATSDIEEALTKIKELVTIVKSVEYMDINNPTILDEELEKKESLRVELAGLIDSKNYEGLNSEAIKGRIDYLNNEIESNNEIVAKYQNEVNSIDEFIENTLGKKINSLETEIISQEKSLAEYKELLKEKENAPKTKTNLEQAIVKKQKEIQVLDNILAAYKEDLLTKINETNTITDKVGKIKETNSKYEKELEGLEKLALINFQTKDLVEEEKDKEDLRKLNEEIKQIKRRKEYDKTPNEIYDQIEMSLASMIPANTRTDKNKGIELTNEVEASSFSEIETENLIDSKVETLDDNSSNEKTNGEINNIVDKTIEGPIVLDSLENTNEVKDEVSPEKNRIKVVEMIPVETIKKKVGGNV